MGELAGGIGELPRATVTPLFTLHYCKWFQQSPQCALHPRFEVCRTCNLLFEWRHVQFSAQPARTSRQLLKNPGGDEQPIVTAVTESIGKIKLIFNSLEAWPTQARVCRFSLEEQISGGNCRNGYLNPGLAFVAMSSTVRRLGRLGDWKIKPLLRPVDE